MLEDTELLRRYVEEESEVAFAELVRRHVNFVYACALRRVGGDSHLAEDVTQQVFVALARGATALLRRQVLGGWLFTAARNAAAQVVRSERRRFSRESEAQAMNELTSSTARDVEWERLRPVLDEAMDELCDADREAVLLRFFEGRPFADVGARLRVTENAARMRVERALDKMHPLLARRGVKSTSAALALALANQATVAAPAGLAATVTSAAMASAAAGGGVMAATILFANMTKLQIGIAGALAVVVGAGYLMLRHQVAVTPTRQQNRETLPAENQRPGSIAAEIETLRRGNVEVKQLAQHAAEVRRATEELDWTRTLVPLDQLRNVGRKTPGAAICTAYWAAASGEDAVLDSCLFLSETDSAKVVRYWETLSPEQKSLYPEPRALVRTAFAYLTLNGVAATRILEEVTDLEGRTRVNTEEKPPIYENRFRRNVVTRWIPMEWRSAGWQIRVSAQILEVFSTPKVPANVQRPKGE